MDEVVSAIEGVTLEDVNRVARELVDEKRLNLAIVGPFRSDKRFRKVFSL